MTINCREGCGACCIAPSITSPLPGMPQGKPAGVSCIQLDEEMRCKVFGQPGRPAFCVGLKPAPEMCGASHVQTLFWLNNLEKVTRPSV